MENKKILILTSRFGGGHLKAADELKKVFLSNNFKCEVFDPFLVNEKKYDFLQKLYRFVSIKLPYVWGFFFYLTDKFQSFQYFFENDREIIESLIKKIENFKPDYLLSTYPMFDKIINKRLKKRDFPIGTVITDSITINRTWLRGESDFYFVIDPHSREELIKKGINRDKIFVTGFPVFVPGTKKIKKEEKVLLMYHHKRRDFLRLLKSLDNFVKFKIVITTSKNEKLFNLLENRYKKNKNIEVYRWIENLSEKLGTYKFVVTKAGGAIVNEVINSNTIPIISYVTKGQEVGNKILVEKYHLGYVLEGRDKGKKLRYILENMRDEEYYSFISSIKKFPYKNGAYKILMEILKQI